MKSARLLDCLASDFRRLRSLAAEADPDTGVPTCPGWTMSDLIHHVGMVYRLDAAGRPETKLGLCGTAAGMCHDDRVAAVILALRCDPDEAARRWIDHGPPLNAEELARIAA